jgi:hypothetical protein
MNNPITMLFYQNFTEILLKIDSDKKRAQCYTNFLNNLYELNNAKVFKSIFSEFTQALHEFYLLTEDEKNLNFQNSDELTHLIMSAYKMLETTVTEESMIKPQLKKYANSVRTMSAVLLDRFSRKHDNLIGSVEKPAVLIARRTLDSGREQYVNEDSQ